MADNWTKLKWRLQAVANNEANGGCPGVALIFVNVFLSCGLPIGWYKPQRIMLEPRNFDISILPIIGHAPKGWDDLMHSLVPGEMKRATGVIDRILVVREGEPVGWLEKETIFA